MLKNKRIYSSIILAIIIVIYIWMIFTGGIISGPTEKESIPIVGGLSPAVMPRENITLIYNILIIILSIGINILFIIKDKNNKINKIILLIIIILSVCFVPIAGYGYLERTESVHYITLFDKFGGYIIESLNSVMAIISLILAIKVIKQHKDNKKMIILWLIMYIISLIPMIYVVYILKYIERFRKLCSI